MSTILPLTPGAATLETAQHCDACAASNANSENRATTTERHHMHIWPLCESLSRGTARKQDGRMARQRLTCTTCWGLSSLHGSLDPCLGEESSPRIRIPELSGEMRRKRRVLVVEAVCFVVKRPHCPRFSVWNRNITTEVPPIPVHQRAA